MPGLRTRRLPLCTASLASLVTALGTLHCSSDPERPPPYTPPAVEDPRSCIELRERGQLVGSELHVDGKRANCAADGLKCGLSGSAVAFVSCDGGADEAVCSDMVWRFRCGILGDAANGSP